LIALESLTDEELAALRIKFADIAERARKDEEKIASLSKLNGKGRQKARTRTAGGASAANGRNGSRSRATAA
jgi:hypothetical protein